MPKTNKRGWQPREMRMVAEWLIRTHSRDRTQTRVRLGPIQPRSTDGTFASDAEYKMAGIWRRWADAIVFKKDQVIIIEAAIRPHPGDIMMLKLYEKLFRKTPEFAKYADYPIKLLLLYAIDDLNIRLLANEYNIPVEIYLPQWVVEYVNNLEPRKRKMEELPLFP